MYSIIGKLFINILKLKIMIGILAAVGVSVGMGLFIKGVGSSIEKDIKSMTKTSNKRKRKYDPYRDEDMSDSFYLNDD